MPGNHPEQLRAALVGPIVPASKLGVVTGISGFLLGGGVGILRSAHPGLVAIYTGTQFFVLGGSFLYTREVTLRTAFAERTRNADLISSTAAGAISGAAAGAFYGRVNSVGGALLLGTIGHLGQRYMHAQANAKAGVKDKRPLMDRLADSKWIPFKSISNTEYESMLTEKLLKVEAEISMIDDKLSMLRQGGADSSQTVAMDTPPTG